MKAKRFLSFVLSLSVLSSTFLQTSFATDIESSASTEEQKCVCTVKCPSDTPNENCSVCSTNGADSCEMPFTVEGGIADYDYENKVLTIKSNGITVSMEGESQTDSRIEIGAGVTNVTLKDIKIESEESSIKINGTNVELTLDGKNELKSRNGHGIEAVGLKLQGDGALEASTDSNAAIYCGGNLDIECEVIANASSKNSNEHSNGIYCGGKLTINSKVTANSKGYGIYCGGELETLENALILSNKAINKKLKMALYSAEKRAMFTARLI